MQRLHAYQQGRQRDMGNEAEAPPAEFDGGLKIPAHIFSKLFDYQKTGAPFVYPSPLQSKGQYFRPRSSRESSFLFKSDRAV